MQTIISKKHVTWETVNGEEREVVRLWIAVTSSSDLPTKRSIPGLTLHEGSRAWDISGAKNYGWTENGVWNEQPSGGSGPGIVKIKGTVSSVSDLPSTAEPGWFYFVGLPTDDAYSEYVYTDDDRWEFIGYNTITIDDALSTTSENPVQNKIITTALNGKATAATTLSGYGITDAKFTPSTGTIQLGSNTLVPVTTIQINGTAQTNTNGTVNLPAYPTTLPASDTTNTYNPSGTVPVSGQAVASAISTKANLSMFTAMSEADYEALVTKTEPLYFIYD